MAILIDVLFAAMLVGFLIAGLRFGMIRSLFGLIGSVVSLAASVVLGNLFAGWLYTGVFRGPMVDQISKAVAGQSGAVASQTETALSALPGFISNALQNAGISARQVGQAAAASADPFAQGVADYVSPVLIHLTALVITVLLFCLFRTGTFFLVRLIDRFFRLPVLRTLNWIGGGVFGLLRGALVGLILATAALVIIPLLPPETARPVQQTIDQSYVCRWVYEYNPVRGWFAADLKK